MEGTSEAVTSLLSGMALPVVLYYGWLVIFVITLAGIWRSTLKFTRLLCFALNQVATWAMVASDNLTLMAVTDRATPTAAAAVAALVVGWWLFERRRRDLSAASW